MSPQREIQSVEIFLCEPRLLNHVGVPMHIQDYRSREIGCLVIMLNQKLKESEHIPVTAL